MALLPTTGSDLTVPIATLIERCINNDLHSQEQLYRYCYAPMIRICLRYGGDMDKAGLIFNDAMLKVFRGLTHYRHENKFWGWVKAIVINCCLDHVKKETRFPQTDSLITEIEIQALPAEVIERLSAKDIRSQINQLPRSTAVVFNLFVYEGYTHKQISEALQISEGTSKWQVSHARKILYKKLKDYLNSETNHL